MPHAVANCSALGSYRTVSEAAASDREPVAALVAQVFACPPELALHILTKGHIRRFPGQTTLIHQGDEVATVFLLLLGRAQAIVYTADGQIVFIQEYRRGDLFGAICEIEAVRQDADVLAVEEVAALTLEASELARLAESHGVIGLALSRMLATRLRAIAGRFYERAALSAVGRVYAELLREARCTPDGRLSPAPVIADLALRVATTRETASRAVSALERRGIIRRDAGSLTVVAPHRLEVLVI